MELAHFIAYDFPGCLKFLLKQTGYKFKINTIMTLLEKKSQSTYLKYKQEIIAVDIFLLSRV